MLLARAYAIAALEVLPFFLQFLGLGLSETLGEGLCGSALGVSEAEAVRYGLVSEYYFYGQAFLVLLALKATYALGLVLLRFMYPGEDPPFAPLVWRLGVGLSSALLLLFLLTRTLPLPFPTFRPPGPPFPPDGRPGALPPRAPLEGPAVRLPPLVYLLGAVSFLMDVASEMAYPLLPLFLASLGAGPGTIGLVEGVAEATASLFKVVGGRLSDRLGRRRPFLLLGYGLPALFRPLLALAQSPFHVLLYRFLDRTGKGLRTAPRDALIAESAPKEALGRAYGLHRSLDTLGATLGPFLAFLLLPLLGFRGVFWLSALPALLAFLLLFAVRETPRPPSPLPPLALGHLSPGYRRFLLVSGLFALALSSNAFLLLRLKELGLSQEEVALAYTLYNLLYALLAYPLGGLADRVGLGRMVATGFGLYALVYLGFAWARTAFWALGFLFLYALYSAAFEGANRAYLATLVPEEAKAGAIGLYHTVVGVLLLPASLLFGLLWQAFGAAAAFLTGAALALGALLLFLVDGTGRRAYPG